ncbi:dual specificity mitogen-activated protein kinase kinase 4-like [Actinia tenebrosa]|uniref:mitogen-activated protein kinase kinase n=1 Tax=Actinia tenebrosa TaxID=6105 RepID=A0A6P8ILZ1_ACTTE|nr:dual specificity mitogen-activated protein kinase kinase 4-like [Actinia tenebrosa]
MASNSPGTKISRERLKLDFKAGIDRKKVTLIVKQQEPQVQDLPSVHMERLKAHKAVGKLTFGSDSVYEYTADDLVDYGEIGRGAYGTVNKMFHPDSNTFMAVKRIRSTVDQKDQKQLLMDLDVVMRSSKCPLIVKFYGALFTEGDAWICMELMEISFDKCYRIVYGYLHQTIPEDILGKVALAVVKALDYLKTELNIIHRDVKPSNILLDKQGCIKLCDFGISGQLVDSIAKTRDAGCKPYMAPERIDPSSCRQGYDIRSDVWSFGITMIELASGKFPYPKWTSVFDQLSQVVEGDPPRLVNDEFIQRSPELLNFVNICLTKEVAKRPKYAGLLRHPFILRYQDEPVDVGSWLARIVAQAPEDPELPDLIQ